MDKHGQEGTGYQHGKIGGKLAADGGGHHDPAPVFFPPGGRRTVCCSQKILLSVSRQFLGGVCVRDGLHAVMLGHVPDLELEMCFAGNDLLCRSTGVLRKCIDGYFSCLVLSVDLDFKKRIVIM